jgi:hypothetical protein
MGNALVICLSVQTFYFLNLYQNNREKLDSEEETPSPPKENKYDYRKIYWDRDGNLRYGSSVRNRDEELITVLAADSNDDSDPSKLWFKIILF